MFDPLRRSVDEEERRHQGQEQPQSPNQTHGRAPHPHSTTSANSIYPPHSHRAPPSPRITELPPISTALYSRDSAASKYYDPTTDHGDRDRDRDRELGQDTTRYDTHYHTHYPAQVRHPMPDTGITS
jgi:DNA helicase INO80